MSHFPIDDGMFVLWVFFSCCLAISITLFGYHWYITRNRLESRDYATAVLIGAYTAFWYSLSITFTIFNKWFLNHWHGGFEFPIITTSGHMIIKFLLSRVWSCHPSVSIEPISCGILCWIVCPIGIATAFDVMLSNQSLVFISVSIYTIIKATAVINVYMFTLLFGLETFRWKVFLTVITIALGLGAAVYTNTNIALIGVVLCFGAAMFGGLRWVLTQILLLVDHQSENPFTALYHFSPASAICLLPFAYGLEWRDYMTSKFAESRELVAYVMCFVVVGGIISFWLVLLEVHLLRLTSSLTIGVLGQVKELLQILLALVIFHEHLSGLNIAGLMISLSAAAYYRVVKAEVEDLDAEAGQDKYDMVNQDDGLDVFNDIDFTDNSDNESDGEFFLIGNGDGRYHDSEVILSTSTKTSRKKKLGKKNSSII